MQCDLILRDKNIDELVNSGSKVRFARDELILANKKHATAQNEKAKALLKYETAKQAYEMLISMKI